MMPQSPATIDVEQQGTTFVGVGPSARLIRRRRYKHH
jgi:hypothetical protein